MVGGGWGEGDKTLQGSRDLVELDLSFPSAYQQNHNYLFILYIMNIIKCVMKMSIDIFEI